MQPRITLLTAFLLGASLASAQSSEYLDSSFNGTGRRTLDIGTTLDQGAAVVLQRDAKIVVAGYSYGTKWDFALTRLLPNGTTDNSFGNGGKVTTSFGNTTDQAAAVAVDTTGRILVAGFTINNGEDAYALARYKPNGSLDSTFDGDGLLTTVGFLGGRAKGVVVEMDGAITVCGSAVTGSTHGFGLLRLKNNGAPDNSFGTGGKVINTLSGSTAQATALAIQPDGKVVVAGSVSNTGWDFALVRYKIDGTPDPSFGTQGIVITDMGTPDDMAASVVLQPDGKILVAGQVKTGGVLGFALARYLSNGLPDVSFGTGGKVLSPTGMPNAYANSVLLQSTGKIILAGVADSGGVSHFALERYRSNGTPDSSFSGDGRILTPMGTSYSYIMGAALQVDDKVVAAGWSWNAGKNEFAIARYLPVPDAPSGVPGCFIFPGPPRVYPVPAGETVHLGYSLNRAGRLTVRLTDGLGRVLRTYAWEEQPKGTYERELQLPAGLPGGMYYLTLSTPEGTVSVKLVK